jgi:hypothetical protein
VNRIPVEKIEKAKVYFGKAQVFTVAQLCSFLQCSIPSARVKIKQWQSYTSYNQNGRFYTLPQVPCFNENGIWQYQNTFFSMHGNLRKTVVYLVRKSDTGLSGEQLSLLLCLPYRSFLHHFKSIPGIRREKMQGVFVYFSDDPVQHERQVKNRVLPVDRVVKPLTESETIVILVALIKQQAFTAEQLIALPDVQKNKISTESIQKFLKKHGLQKKIPVPRL